MALPNSALSPEPRAAPTSDAGPWTTDQRARALVRGQAPLRRVLARLAARLVAVRAWERLGFARLDDYARERVGLSARQLYDLAHVDAALSGLPHVEAAFLEGALPWSKARLVCRVAEPGDEAQWLALAQRVPVRALEREVRAVDRASIEAGALMPDTDEDGAPVWPRKTVEVRCTPYVQGKWVRARWLAQRVAGEKLPPWACMEAVVGEVLSALPLADDPLAAACEAKLDDACAGIAAANAGLGSLSRAQRLEPEEAAVASCEAADVCKTHAPGEVPPALAPLPPFLLPLAEDLDEADAFTLDARLRRAVLLEQRAWAELGALLATLSSEHLYLAAGNASLSSYARECLGLSPRKARALLRLERAALLCPALRTAYRDGTLSWVQAQALVPLVLLDHFAPWWEAWIEHAAQVTVRRLEDDVEQAVALGDGRPPDPRQTCAKPMHGGGDTEPAPRQAETARFFFTAPRDVGLLIDAAISTVRRHLERQRGRLATRGEAMDAMFEHAFEVWSPHAPHVSREHRVFERDGWRCTAPGCSSYRNLQDHHVVFRSAGGSDALSNRTTLCAWHHLRGVHAGIIRCAGDAPDHLVFELGLRAAGPPLARYRGDQRIAGPA